MAWSTEKEAPQLHEVGVFLRFHPYLRHSASRNSPLCKRNLCSATGKTVSHAEDPFSRASSTECWSCGYSCPCLSCARCSCNSLLLFFMQFFSFRSWFLCTAWLGGCATIRATREAVMCLDASKAWVDSDMGLTSPFHPV